MPIRGKNLRKSLLNWSNYFTIFIKLKYSLSKTIFSWEMVISVGSGAWDGEGEGGILNGKAPDPIKPKFNKASIIRKDLGRDRVVFLEDVS